VYSSDGLLKFLTNQEKAGTDAGFENGGSSVELTDGSVPVGPGTGHQRGPGAKRGRNSGNDELAIFCKLQYSIIMYSEKSRNHLST